MAYEIPAATEQFGNLDRLPERLACGEQDHMIIRAVMPVGGTFRIGPVRLVEGPAALHQFLAAADDGLAAGGVALTDRFGGERHAGAADLRPVVGRTDPPLGLRMAGFDFGQSEAEDGVLIAEPLLRR